MNNEDHLVGGLTGGYSRKLHKKKHCAGNEKGTGSCLDADLIKIAGKTLNQMRDSKNQIDLSKPCHEIHEDICRILDQMYGCGSEACLLTMDAFLSKLGKHRKRFIESFQLVMPKEWMKTKGKTAKAKRKKKKKTKKKKKFLRVEEAEVDPEHLAKEQIDENAMLSTDEIEEFLKRLRQKDESFYDYGAVPIDFSDCSVSHLCKFNCREHLSKGQTKIGVVFNTDPHNREGEHWIALYAELKPCSIPGVPAIYYYDSYGRKPPKRVRDLIVKMQKQGEECGKPFKYFYNDHQFQKHGTQCGMYAIDFINQMLSGKTFEEYLNGGVSDERMKDLRDDYFIDPNEL